MSTPKPITHIKKLELENKFKEKKDIKENPKIEQSIPLEISPQNDGRFLGNHLGRKMKQGIHHKHLPLNKVVHCPNHFMVSLSLKDKEDTQKLGYYDREKRVISFDTHYRFTASPIDLSLMTCEFKIVAYFFKLASGKTAFPVYLNDIISTNLNVDKNIFKFFIVAKVNGEIARLKLEMNMLDYCETDSVLDDQMIQMIARYLKGAYYGLPHYVFEYPSLTPDKTWQKKFDETMITFLESITDPIFEENRKIKKELTELNMILNFLNRPKNSNELLTIYKEKQRILESMVRKMKSVKAQSLRKEFLDHFLQSRMEKNWDLTTHAMAHYIKILSQVLGYVSRWHSHEPDFNNFMVQVIDIASACKASGKNLKEHVINYFIKNRLKFEPIQQWKESNLSLHFNFERKRKRIRVESEWVVEECETENNNALIL